MELTALQQFSVLLEELLEERGELQARLDAINETLGNSPAVEIPAPVKRRPKALPPEQLKKTGRRGNARSLKEMVLDATKSEPKTKQEILAAVQKAGYKFATSNPLNSLSTFLYTSPQIKKDGDKFGPA